MKYFKVIRFPFEPIPSRADEMIEGKLLTALSDLSRANGCAMRPTNISFLVLGEVYMTIIAEPLVSNFEQGIIDHIQAIEAKVLAEEARR